MYKVVPYQLPSSIHVTESISGSVVPLAMFVFHPSVLYVDDQYGDHPHNDDDGNDGDDDGDVEDNNEDFDDNDGDDDNDEDGYQMGIIEYSIN